MILLQMCGYTLFLSFYLRNPLFNCSNILDNRITVVADCDKSCPYPGPKRIPIPEPSPEPTVFPQATPDQDYDTDYAYIG